MALQTSISLEFEVRRCPWEIVTPADPTPRELRLLSDLDDATYMRFNIPFVFLYRHDPSSPMAMAGKDPVEVIRQALAKTLVFYYPLAGRLKEAPNGKLMVDCNNEGVIFIEADADVTVDQLGNDPQPPFPCFDELLYDVPGSDETINCPLLLVQVTRLKCGGFFFAIRFNHTICDATGITLFLKGLVEIARGAPKPSIIPVWQRELLCARDPPRVTYVHHEYQKQPIDDENIIIIPHQRSFFFGPTEIAAIRGLLPSHLAQSTTTEVLAAFLWRCRTIALQWENPNQEICFCLVVNARYGRASFNPPLPDGFYGNAFVFPRVVTTAGELCRRPLEYALELVKKAKNKANEEYVHSVIDLMAIDGKPSLSFGDESLEAYVVSDLTKAELRDVNFGWGKPVYGGISIGYLTMNLIVPYTNSKGEQGRSVIICLPSEAIERFATELDNLLKQYSLHQKMHLTTLK